MAVLIRDGVVPERRPVIGARAMLHDLHAVIRNSRAHQRISRGPGLFGTIEHRNNSLGALAADAPVRALPAHTPVLVNAIGVGAIGPIRLGARGVSRCGFKACSVHVHAIPTQVHIVVEGVPRQRVITRTYSQKAAERHDRIRDLARELVDHKMVYTAEVLSIMVVYGRSIDLL